MFELTKVNDVFADFKQQLKEAKELNEQTVFNYEDIKGNKEARSHIYKLRQTASAVDKVRKAEKAESLEYGRAIDSTAKEIAEELRAMIAVHEEPIKAIEEREKKRIEDIETNINFFIFYTCDENTYKPLFELKLILESIEEKNIDDSFCEFVERAELAKFKAVDFLKKKIEKIELAEKEEKKRLKEIEVQQEKERIDNEEIAKIEQEKREIIIAEKARIKAEENAKRNAEIVEQNRINEINRIENEKIQAIKNAENEAKQKIIAEQKRISDEKEREEHNKRIIEEKEIKRQSNRAHQKRINNTVLEYLKQLGCDDVLGKNIITSLAKQEIPNVTINY